MNREVLQLQVQITTAGKEFEAVKARYPQLAQEQEMQAEIDRLSQAVAEKKSLLDLNGSGQGGQVILFTCDHSR